MNQNRIQHTTATATTTATNDPSQHGIANSIQASRTRWQRTLRWVGILAVGWVVAMTGRAAHAQSAGKHRHAAHHRMHHRTHHATHGHASHYHHTGHASHRSIAIATHYVAPVPVLTGAPIVSSGPAAYPLGQRFHHLVIQQKLPARVAWNNGQYWIWYGGRWCEYGWFVRTQVGGNWDWYLGRYRSKYALVIKQCQP